MSEGKDEEYEIKYSGEPVNLFLKDYCTPSFGALSGKEVQVLVFRLFLDQKLIKLEDSDYVIARKLRIDPSKVRSLKFDYNNLYGSRNKENLKKDIIELFKKSFDEEKGIQSTAIYKKRKICILVDDVFLKEYIIKELRDLNLYYDTSFNKDILKISIDQFMIWTLENKYINEEDWKSCLRKTNSEFKILDAKLNKLSWKDLKRLFLEKVTDWEIVIPFILKNLPFFK